MIVFAAACVPAGRPAAPAAPRIEPAPAPKLVYRTTEPPRDPVATRNLPPPAMSDALNAVTRGFAGKLGVAVMRIDANWIYGHEAEHYFAQQSVSKLWVALALLDGVDDGRLRLDQRVRIGPDDLTLFHQPIAKLVGSTGYETTVRDLLTRAMTQSDNSANDRLLRLVGGSANVRAALTEKNISGIRFGPGERLMQSRTAGLEWKQSYSIGQSFYTARAKLDHGVREAAISRYLIELPDGAQPQAIVHALARLARGTLLAPSSNALLLDLLHRSETGRYRVAAGVPAGWRYGHKTGTGQSFNGLNTGFNDVGILTAPDGTRYAIAVLIGSTRQPIPACQKMMQAIATAITTAHRR